MCGMGGTQQFSVWARATVGDGQQVRPGGRVFEQSLLTHHLMQPLFKLRPVTDSCLAMQNEDSNIWIWRWQFSEELLHAFLQLH